VRYVLSATIGDDDPDDDEGDMLPEMSPDEWAARYVTPN